MVRTYSRSSWHDKYFGEVHSQFEFRILCASFFFPRDNSIYMSIPASAEVGRVISTLGKFYVYIFSIF